ncbi:hypothetical protein HFO07_26730 [Rhizobium leguminosarum]|uniref:hypothetical protein n=1 Tax=Rhizobium leguminosarum TaxID=384 RepID=UPI001C94C4CE|nr:hypothetical protein [Rhizobium leguminosarum]MBY5760210.1 hypothetical protein [Rhizobium leguminosarum]
MTSHQNLMLYAKLAGFRLVVLANRFGCDTSFSRELHHRLIEGLEAAIYRIQTIMELEHRLVAGTDDEFTAFQLEGETEILGRTGINLLDELEIDHDTNEYRINDDGWINALAADDSGVEIDYPTLVSLTEQELGSLAPIIKNIMRETGIPVHAARAVAKWELARDEPPF